MASQNLFCRYLFNFVLFQTLFVCLFSVPVKHKERKITHRNIHGGNHINDQALFGEPVAFLGEDLIELPKKAQIYGLGGSDEHTGEYRPKQPVSPAKTQTCAPITTSLCGDTGFYPLAQFPNALGHHSEDEALAKLQSFAPLLKDKICGADLKTFLCLYLFPPCTGTYETKLPCRSVCKAAKSKCGDTMRRTGLSWRPEWDCQQFPSRGQCADVNTMPVPKPLTKPIPSHSPQISNSSHTNKDKSTKAFTIKSRVYDIGVTGQTDLFQGWADVQGLGAANDYCRVIGANPETRFLSCVLAGSVNPDHHYVSKRGFDVGHRHTWFMRDMDGDGRDDYCRCVGYGIKSVVFCMKAGVTGFYGSPHQAGSEFSFKLPTTGPCLQKQVNPFLGI